MVRLPFRDRLEAGRFLGEKLLACKFPQDTIILALPRGGVPVAYAVADTLGLPLDVVVVRKLGVPMQPELAMGAIAGAGTLILEDAIIREFQIPEATVTSVIRSERSELERRERLYRKGRAAPDLQNRTVILIDDGMATGSTMYAAALYANSFRPAAVIVAVPVSSAQVGRQFKPLIADCISLATPSPFHSVSTWYSDFQQVTDSEVQHLLDRNQQQPSRRM